MTATTTPQPAPGTPPGTLLERTGLFLTSLGGSTVPRVREAVAEIEAQGWPSLWFGEAVGREAFSQAQILLDATSTLRVATGIANIWARDAHVSGAVARTFEALYPGRFTLGLGVSHAPLVRRRNHDYSRPYAAMRAYLEALARTHPEAAGEDRMPDVVIAALGPKMLALSGELAQGAFPYLTTPEHTARAREILGGSAADGPALVVEQGAVISPDAIGNEDEWRRRAHDHLEIYTGLPNYRNSWARLGFGDADFVRGGSERLKRAMVPCGVEETIERVRAHFDAGASEVVVQVLGTDVFDLPLADWRALADALK